MKAHANVCGNSPRHASTPKAAASSRAAFKRAAVDAARVRAIHPRPARTTQRRRRILVAANHECVSGGHGRGLCEQAVARARGTRHRQQVRARSKRRAVRACSGKAQCSIDQAQAGVMGFEAVIGKVNPAGGANHDRARNRNQLEVTAQK